MAERWQKGKAFYRTRYASPIEAFPTVFVAVATQGGERHNARARSPKIGSSPFLTKTIDEQAESEFRVPSSPLKKAWTDHESPDPNVYDSNENYIPNDNDEIDVNNDNAAFQDADSSPFREDAREDTVDYQKLQEYQQRTPSQSRHRFGMGPAEDPMSSPFRPEGKDETVDFQRLREIQPMSPGLSKRLAIDNPESSPFRPEGKDETVDFDRLRELRAESPDFDEQPLDPESSPLRFDPREGTVDFHDIQECEGKRESMANSQPTPPKAHSSPFRPDAGDDTLDMRKLRPTPRLSPGMENSHSNATTPRKRSFDQTPQDYGEDAETNERAKKGMLSRAEGPEIHIDLEDESSVIHDQSLLSTASTSQDRSTIANSMIEDKHNEGMSTVLHDNDDMMDKENDGHDAGNANLSEDDHDPMDDTGLSNFSVLPDMTSFANLRADSPLKSMRGSVGPSLAATADMYRRSVDPATPGTARRSHRASALLDVDSPIGSPTPRRRVSRDIGNPERTPNLLDFSDQMNFYPRHSTQQNSQYSPRRSPVRNVRQSMRSPSKLSLLDFDIPPAPTPRSIPTVTPRELESLKSGFMSEISSLKATLSGKEAEVACLKTAVGDAERRVGEALEEIRNEVARRETLEIEQAEWDRRGKDMERVLQSVRSELEDGEHERDRLTRKAEDAEKSKEQLESRIVELETQLSTARSSTSESANQGSRRPSQSAEDTAREVQDAVEKVARELHTLYKGKHETKVAALKKSYESRWEKRLRESDNKLTAAREENERLKAERNAADSDSMAAANASMIAREIDEHEAEKRVFEAQIQGLQHEMAALKEDSERLRSELRTERAEKGELVAAVDEWLNIQATQPAPVQQQEREPSVSSAGIPEEDYQSTSEPHAENLRRSVSRSGSSGIRPPSTTEKKGPRFGAPGGHSRGNSGGKSGIAVFTPGRGGIMSSIERMGRGGA
ncbi:Central kinetochore-associated [Penicillium frequentans]|nr:Central kinetochore-associated [Penicillium glabrum]